MTHTLPFTKHPMTRHLITFVLGVFVGALLFSTFFSHQIGIAQITSLPSPWQSQDIGAVGATGSASFANDAFTVQGSGADIWNKIDEFHFVYQQMSGDVTLITKVDSLTNTNSYAKAGVMIRESLGSNSKNAAVIITPSKGIKFQYRTSTGGGSGSSGSSGKAPYWLKLERKGNIFTAYKSTNGTGWSKIKDRSFAMNSEVYVGLAVTSHNDGTLTTAKFSSVSVDGQETGGGGEPPRTDSDVDDIIAPLGCSMAHCDQAMSDITNTTAPQSPVTTRWHDTTVAGSGVGLGCSSNGKTAVCAMKPDGSKNVSVRVYDASGTKLWSSTALGIYAYTSAPMISDDGTVIAMDGAKVIRFSPTGQIVWTTPIPDGIPISPNVTDNGMLVVTTLYGPYLLVYNYDTGALLKKHEFQDSVVYNGITYQGYWESSNTAAVKGQRTYVSTQFRTNDKKVLPFGRLFALDIQKVSSSEATVTPIWHFDFKATSGASPALSTVGGQTTIYFDGSGLSATEPTVYYAFAVKDLGNSGQLLWKYQMKGKVEASPAKDPRGGMWYFAPGFPDLIRLSEESGSVLQQLNIDTLVNQSGVHGPASALMIAGSSDAPIMLVSATPSDKRNTYVSSINLLNGNLLWSVRVDEGKGSNGVAHSQFPIVYGSNGKPVIVLSTNKNGVWGIGQQ